MERNDLIPELVLENPESGLKVVRVDDAEQPADRDLIVHPFKRWVNSLRSKKSQRRCLEKYVEDWPVVDGNNLSPYQGTQDQQWERLSGHSSQLGTVKTVSMSIASPSVVRSRGTTQSTTNNSGNSDSRTSADSLRPILSLTVDEAAHSRSIKRRQILQEIVSTESDYIAGLKSLSNMLDLFSIRSEICGNIQRIREIHDRFLLQLQNVTPKSDVNEAGIIALASRELQKQRSTIGLSGLKELQNRSLRTRSMKSRMNTRVRLMGADPYEALEVAREIDNLSISFTAYEEFCSNYELLTQDVALLRRSVHNWGVLDQGIEALSKSVVSMENRKSEEHKSMTLNDLLIKVGLPPDICLVLTGQPIQRLCKYPLLLQDLLRHTPISDCPSSHDGIRQILESIRTLVTRINSATGSPINKDRIQKTILLQGKLGFSETVMLQNIYKQLGPMILCGVLHVTYQAPEYIAGQYMVCALFNSYFLLCTVKDDYRRLQAVACLYVCDMKFDTVRNGRGKPQFALMSRKAHGIGLCCYGCLYSWKLIFQELDDNFELILGAASATEERQWKTEILKRTAALADATNPGPAEPRRFSFSSLDLAPLDRATHAALSLARRSSMHSLSTSLVKPNLQHIVIKKTHCPNFTACARQVEGEMDRPKIPSSQSAMILTARRHDRVRLERFISDVYTRDALPFPGMTLAKGDILLRPGVIMRRRFSIRPGFGRRSTSLSMPHQRRNVTDAGSVPESIAITDEASEKNSIMHKSSEHSLEFDRKEPSREDFPSALARAKTVRLRGVSKQMSKSDLWSPGDEKGPTESSPRKGPLLQTIFKALGVRRMRRTRSSTGSGA